MLSERVIIGLDPGLTCGYAQLDGDTFTSYDLSPMDACTMLEQMLQRGRPTIIAAERFTFQASSSRKTRQYDALEIIGAARYLCHKYIATFTLYGASEAQRIGSREVLRALGWWQPGKDHCNKAAAQVAIAYAQTHPSEFEARLRPGIV